MFKHLPPNITEAAKQGMAPWKDPIRNDFHVLVFEDIYPVTPGHLLFIPRYPTPGVIKDCFLDALDTGEKMVAEGKCDSFNIGMNLGKEAGQTCAWPHIHLIPRRNGDTVDPIGGVRNVIPGQGNYKIDTYKNPVIDNDGVAEVMRKTLELAQKELNNYKTVK